ncbi:hypothetical protein ABMA27_000355 [Loxostege sticticalis]|uniref:Tc1-like transposase DDE domain-containing protein n=1 Tax=Loxostege sticticalis TaxID=481309 RepID=A0ABR3IN50_LOXSC
MNFENYVTWLTEKLLPNLPEKAVIVMDNASYHNTRSSTIPTSNSRKADMQKWLTENGIPFDEQARRIELYDLNAIENIWGILQNQIASRNIGQNMKNVQNLIYEGLNNINNDTWYNTYKHVEKIEKEYMKYFVYDYEFVIHVDESSVSDTIKFGSESEANEFGSDSDSLNEEY